MGRAGHTANVVIALLVLLSFVAGTSLTCLQKGAGSVAAEECCQKHCQHAMTGETAAKCCQELQAKVPPALLASPLTKTAAPVAYTLPRAPVSLVALQEPDQCLVQCITGERAPPFIPSYLLHCALLL